MSPHARLFRKGCEHVWISLMKVVRRSKRVRARVLKGPVESSRLQEIPLPQMLVLSAETPYTSLKPTR